MTPVVDEEKRQLKGSPSRDAFKRRHKDCAKWFYACDLDLVLVGKSPYRIIAFFDYKTPKDKITFSEAIAFNILKAIAPIFIIRSENPDSGPFTILQFHDADPKPEPPVCTITPILMCRTYEDLEQWEQKLRVQNRLGLTTQNDPAKSSPKNLLEKPNPKNGGCLC